MTSLRLSDSRSRLDLPASDCRVCGKAFIKFNTLQVVCGVACARRVPIIAKNTVKAEAKAERAKTAARKEAIKTRSDYMKEAQREFNKFVRYRDVGKLCICCGVPLGSDAVGGAFDCGHYRSVGSAPHLRFNEQNAHAQRKQCNRWGAGRAVDYRIGLIARIGAEAVEVLEADQSSPKWSIEDLKAIRDEYRAKTRAIKEKA